MLRTKIGPNATKIAVPIDEHERTHEPNGSLIDDDQEPLPDNTAPSTTAPRARLIATTPHPSCRATGNSRKIGVKSH